jgi:hypothetical protein
MLPAAYHAAEVFCLPSLHEPFGIVILEAWAAGASPRQARPRPGVTTPGPPSPRAWSIFIANCRAPGEAGGFDCGRGRGYPITPERQDRFYKEACTHTGRRARIRLVLKGISPSCARSAAPRLRSARRARRINC